jgi:hypothetical protein
MNPWIYEIIENLDEASEPDVLRALDELECLYDALGDIDRDITEQLIERLNHRLDALRQP